MRDAALEKALGIVGGPVRLAAAIGGITSQAVSQWPRCPAARVIAVETATGGRVSRHELRPDLYPRQETAA